MAEVWAVAGAKNKYLAYWSPLVATVALVTTGAELTGPSMNPAFVSAAALANSCKTAILFCHDDCTSRLHMNWLCQMAMQWF